LYAEQMVGQLQSGASAGVLRRSSPFDQLWMQGLESLAVRTQITHPYSQVGVVYTVVSTIARHAASVPWSLMRGDQAYPDSGDRAHPLYALLKAPNDQLRGSQAFEATYAFREMAGRAYWILDEFARPRATASAIPRRIRIPNPRHLTPDVRRGELFGWKYTGPEGSADLSKDQVLRFAYFDPDNPYRGVGPLEAARLGYSLAWRSGKAQELFYRNGGYPPFYMQTPPEQNLNPEQIRALKEQFREEYLGLENWGKPPIMIRGTELKALGISQRDAEWVSTQRLTTTQVCAVFGIPPFLVGFADEAHMTNSVMFTRNYWGGKVMGIGDSVASVINADLVERFFPGDLFAYDWRTKFAQVLPEETRSSIESARKMWETGVPANQAYALHGVPIDAKGLPHLDVGFIPFSMTPADIAMEPPEPAELPEADGDAEEEDKRLRALRRASPRSERQRAARWASYAKKMEAVERRYLGDWRKFLGWLRDEVVTRINTSKALRPTGRAGLDLILRDDDDKGASALLPPEQATHEQARKLTAASRLLSIKVGWESLFGDLGLAGEIDFNNPRVAALVAKRTQSILGASDTVAQKIRESLGEGLDAGESIEQLAERVRTFMSEQYRGQARTVARTETSAGFSGARTEAMKEAGVPKHEWLSARDDRVRASHMIDAQVRVIGEPFSNGLLEPLDPSAPPEETVNCRCVTLPVVEE